MREPGGDTINIPCTNCRRSMVVPGSFVRSRMKRGSSLVVFCCRKCNTEYVAKRGAAQQEAVYQDEMKNA